MPDAGEGVSAGKLQRGVFVFAQNLHGKRVVEDCALIEQLMSGTLAGDHQGSAAGLVGVHGGGLHSTVGPTRPFGLRGTSRLSTVFGSCGRTSRLTPGFRPQVSPCISAKLREYRVLEQGSPSQSHPTPVGIRKLPTAWRAKAHEKASVETTVLPLEVAVNEVGYRSPKRRQYVHRSAATVVLRSLTASKRREVAPATSCHALLRFSHPLAACWRG